MNWQVSGASALSETGAAQSSSSSLSALMAAAAAVLFRRSRSSASSLVTASCSFACTAFISLTTSQVTPVTACRRECLGQLYLQRIHRADVMHDHSDLAAILGNPGLPLRFGEGVRESGRVRGSFFETFGKGFLRWFMNYLWLMAMDAVSVP